MGIVPGFTSGISHRAFARWYCRSSFTVVLGFLLEWFFRIPFGVRLEISPGILPIAPTRISSGVPPGIYSTGFLCIAFRVQSLFLLILAEFLFKRDFSRRFSQEHSSKIPPDIAELFSEFFPRIPILRETPWRIFGESSRETSNEISGKIWK